MIRVCFLALAVTGRTAAPPITMVVWPAARARGDHSTTDQACTAGRVSAADRDCWNNARGMGRRQPGVCPQLPDIHQPGRPGYGARPPTGGGLDVR